jgi:PhnB protein
MVKAIPDGYHSLTPYLTVADAEKLLEFMKAAFGANVPEVMRDEEGKLRHAEAQIGDSRVMVGQAQGEWTPRPGTLYLYCENTDEVYRRALAAGATSLMEPADQFYGDRNAGVADPTGNWWWIATRLEDLSVEEMQRRMAEQKK